MRLPICVALLLSFLLPAGAESQQSAVSQECKVTRVFGSFPHGPFQTEPTEAYKGSPTVKFLIQEDGSVSEVRITRSSGVADIDRKVVESVAQWKYKPRAGGCGVLNTEMTVIIHSRGALGPWQKHS